MSQNSAAGKSNNANRGAQQAAACAIAITSGKGGVGKTNITTNLGIALAQIGQRVCIVDADTSLANINILLDLAPEYTLEHFLEGDKSLDDITLTGPDNVQIVPSASGISEFAQLNETQQERLLGGLQQLEQQNDYILIDTAAGIGDTVINFIQCAQYAIIVISPEPTSLTDAFSMVKVLQRRNYDQPIYILVNMVRNYGHSMEVFKRFAKAVNQYVHLKVKYLGYLPADQAVRNAVGSQHPVVIGSPDSPAGRCINLLAKIMLKHFSVNDAPKRSLSQFWSNQDIDGESGFAQVHPISPSARVTTIHSPEPEPETEPKPEPEDTDTVETPASAPVSASTSEHVSEAAPTDATTTAEQTPSQENEKEQEQQPLSKQQQLEQLLSAHISEHNSFPAVVLELLLQALHQGQLNESQQHRLVTELLPEDLLNPAATGTEPKLSLGHIEAQINDLVSDAERTKHQLTELTCQLQQQYFALYNCAPTMPQGSPQTPSQNPATGTQTSSPAASDLDQQALQASIHSASRLDY